MNKKSILAAIVALLYAVSFANALDQQTVLAPGTAAPTFSLPGLTGEREALSVYCGERLSKPYVNKYKHIVILSFWATYCKPCQQEMPHLIAFAAAHATDSVKVFCISIDKGGADTVEPFVKKKGWQIPVLLDPFNSVSNRYGVKALPSLVVIDPNGIIRYSSVGFDEKMDINAKLERIVAGIHQGKEIEKSSSSGSSVAAIDNSPDQGASSPSPQQRYKAFIQLEGGESLEKIAGELKVDKKEILRWQADAKKAVMHALDQK